jgi:hypothetical protein
VGALSFCEHENPKRIGRGTAVNLLSAILLLTGLLLVLLAWPGGSILGELSMSRNMWVAYGALCLLLVGSGIILIARQ